MSFTGLLINKSTINHWVTDIWSQRVLAGLDIDVACRIMYAYRLIRNAAGEQVVSAAKLFYDPGQTIDNADTITFDGVEHAIIDIRVRQDSTGIHHKEVFVT